MATEQVITLETLQRVTTRTVDRAVLGPRPTLEAALALVFGVQLVMWSPHLRTEALTFDEGEERCLLLPEALREGWQRRWSQTGAL